MRNFLLGFIGGGALGIYVTWFWFSAKETYDRGMRQIGDIQRRQQAGDYLNTSNSSPQFFDQENRNG